MITKIIIVEYVIEFDARVTHNDFFHLSYIAWSAVNRTSATASGPATGAMLFSLDRDDQYDAIAIAMESER